MIIRERLKFPSGFSTAVLISVLHGEGAPGSREEESGRAAQGGFASLAPRAHVINSPSRENVSSHDGVDDAHPDTRTRLDWASDMRLLIMCFVVSGAFTISTYFFPIIRNIPIFGVVAADKWLWTLNPSLAYVGQGVIMGTETTLHMLLGAIVGWAFLSPLAKHNGWAPGPVNDWEHGSKGWIIWVSLAIMLADAVVSLGFVGIRSILLSDLLNIKVYLDRRIQSQGYFGRYLFGLPRQRYTLLRADDEDDDTSTDSDNVEARVIHAHDNAHADAPPEQLVSGKFVTAGLLTSVMLCIATTHFVFGNLVPLSATIIAVLMALVLSIMGVRALGETDLNPVSGISKLAQLFFALIIPQSNRSSVLINLVAGAVVRSLI